VVVLLLDLHMLLRKVQVQLQLQHKLRRVKKRLNVRFKMNCMIALIPSLKNYLTLTRVSQEGKMRDMPHWMMTLKTIMLELKKNMMIRKKLNTFIL